MDTNRPFRTGLFIFECLRFLLLVVLIIFFSRNSTFSGESGLGGLIGAFFPFLVYMSCNALFPLMALFVWLNLDEYKNYLNLFIAGKIIIVVTFYAWELISTRQFPGEENIAKSMILWWGSAILSFADILTIWGAWTIKRR